MSAASKTSSPNSIATGEAQLEPSLPHNEAISTAEISLLWCDSVRPRWPRCIAAQSFMVGRRPVNLLDEAAAVTVRVQDFNAGVVSSVSIQMLQHTEVKHANQLAWSWEI